METQINEQEAAHTTEQAKSNRLYMKQVNLMQKYKDQVNKYKSEDEIKSKKADEALAASVKKYDELLSKYNDLIDKTADYKSKLASKDKKLEVAQEELESMKDKDEYIKQLEGLVTTYTENQKVLQKVIDQMKAIIDASDFETLPNDSYQRKLYEGMKSLSNLDKYSQLFNLVNASSDMLNLSSVSKIFITIDYLIDNLVQTTKEYNHQAELLNMFHTYYVDMLPYIAKLKDDMDSIPEGIKYTVDEIIRKTEALKVPVQWVEVKDSLVKPRNIEAMFYKGMNFTNIQAMVDKYAPNQKVSYVDMDTSASKILRGAKRSATSTTPLYQNKRNKDTSKPQLE